MPAFRAVALLGVLLLTACAPPPSPEPASLRFIGTWRCDMTTMVFTRNSYSPSPDEAGMPIRQIETRGDETTMTFDNNYQITVKMNGTDQMSWLSGATGDAQQCTRIAGAT
ncbi:hypothetical protein H4P12_10825 [Paracoccus sp. 11-3]|uniref:Uncharacterized protein n=1 Tax=Paracoccus amoyensis TaxID=2760093 RepID=A0A926JCS8_9RHOB|nr:hypothetical protein [Paracoccus amoyensis]MBC9247195.1 hypothetical protein [Paracoccus amoyensis]